MKICERGSATSTVLLCLGGLALILLYEAAKLVVFAWVLRVAFR